MNLIMPRPGFLAGAARAVRPHGAVLIFDEVMTGFRVHPQGAQGLYGITPDLTTLGKVIGGGMPVGAFGGRRAIMEKIAPLGPVYQAGTLSGNPVAVAAGLATLKRDRGARVLRARWPRARARSTDGLAAAARERGRAVFARSRSAACSASTSRPTVPDSLRRGDGRATRKRFNRFFHAMLDAGVYLAPSAFEAGFVSAAHTRDDIAATLARPSGVRQDRAPPAAFRRRGTPVVRRRRRPELHDSAVCPADRRRSARAAFRRAMTTVAAHCRRPQRCTRRSRGKPCSVRRNGRRRVL